MAGIDVLIRGAKVVDGTSRPPKGRSGPINDRANGDTTHQIPELHPHVHARRKNVPTRGEWRG